MINKDDIIKDSFYWDITNWSKSIPQWESMLNIYNSKKLNSLELGCGENGGLSLWLASKGYVVNCSGYEHITEKTKEIHRKYKLTNRIEYSQINALSIPYTDHYDIICFKSMLGGIVRNGSLKIASKVILEIHKALKPGGAVLFVENLSSTFLHKYLRSKYGALMNDWRYFKTDEIKDLFQGFSKYSYKTFGFLGCFGRTEKQKKILSNLDTNIFDFLPEKFHYIISGYGIK